MLRRRLHDLIVATCCCGERAGCRLILTPSESASRLSDNRMLDACAASLYTSSAHWQWVRSGGLLAPHKTSLIVSLHLQLDTPNQYFWCAPLQLPSPCYDTVHNPRLLNMQCVTCILPHLGLQITPGNQFQQYPPTPPAMPLGLACTGRLCLGRQHSPIAVPDHLSYIQHQIIVKGSSNSWLCIPVSRVCSIPSFPPCLLDYRGLLQMMLVCQLNPQSSF